MARGVKFVTNDVDAILRAYVDGRTAVEIAQQCGTSRDTIYRLLKANGVPVREGGRARKEVDPQEAARLYRDGWTVTEIAQIFGCYRSTIDHRLVQAGVKLKPGPADGAPSGDAASAPPQASAPVTPRRPRAPLLRQRA